MKIILRDNFDRETRSDVLIASNVDPFWAKRIAKLLNAEEKDPDTPNFYDAVEDDYKLHKWEP